jgi:hypothetical protein
MFWGRERGWYSLITASLEAQYLQTLASQVVDGKTAAVLSWQGARQSQVSVEVRNRHTAVDSTVYQHVQLELNGGVRGHSRWNAGVQLTLGEEPDVENARLGRIVAARGAMVLTPYDGVSISGVARYEQLRAASIWVYRATISDVRLELYPRLNSRIRLIAQHNSSHRNPHGGVIDASANRTRFAFQALASQRFGTRALVFIGYVGSGSLLENSPHWPEARSIFAKAAWDVAF